MQTITVGDKKFRRYLSYSQIIEAIDRVAEKLNADYRESAGDPPVLLCIMNGSIMFTAEIMKRVEFPVEVASMKLSSYNGTQSTGKVNKVAGPGRSLKGKRVIVCEDIVDTGGTVQALREILESEGVIDTRVCTLLFKPSTFKGDRKPEYAALEVPDDFLVGFGLDYNELGRNFKDIYVIDKQI